MEFGFKTDAGPKEKDFSYHVKNRYLPLLMIAMIAIIVTATITKELPEEESAVVVGSTRLP